MVIFRFFKIFKIIGIIGIIGIALAGMALVLRRLSRDQQPQDESPDFERVQTERRVKTETLDVDPGSSREVLIRHVDKSPAEPTLLARGRALEHFGQPEAAMRTYVLALRSGKHDEASLNIARLYSNGWHPIFVPDKTAAQQVLVAVMESPRVKETTKMAASVRLSELQRVLGATGFDPDVISAPGDAMPLPGSFAWQALDYLVGHDSTRIVGVDRNRNLTAGFINGRTLGATHPPDFRIPDDAEVALRLAGGDVAGQAVLLENARLNAEVRLNEIRVNEIRVNEVRGPVRRGDSQNVHSTTAQNMALARLLAISAGSGSHPAVDSQPDSASRIGFSVQEDNDAEFDAARRSFQEEVRRLGLSTGVSVNAERLLASLTSLTHGRYGKSERDVFLDVLKRINAPENLERSQDMKRILADNLASGIENGRPVCSTGKIMRMLGSLDAMDADADVAQPLKPDWAVNQELATLAAHVRSQFESNADPDSSPDSSDSSDSTSESRMSDLMRKELTERVTREYVDTKILTPSDAAARLAPLLDAL
jgi:hypothetical protein